MLEHLHVKNLALIEETEVDFGEGLNILSGETGAGKSILIGSVNLALGGKMTKEMIREHADYGLVELVFSVDENTEKRLHALDIFPEDGQIIISRKMTGSRSISKINGETCTASVIRKIAGLLLDIHGQHEHQSLLYPDKQLYILDEYGKTDICDVKNQVKMLYQAYSTRKKELDAYEMDADARAREIDFLNFEIGEIEEASLKDQEDEELENQYRKLSNAKKITEALSQVYELTGYERDGSAGNTGRAMSKISSVSDYDENLKNMADALMDIDNLLNDFNREVASYLSEFQFSDGEFRVIEDRLDLINRLKAKYGQSIEKIYAYREEKQEELERLLHFEERKEALLKEVKEQEESLLKASKELTDIRKVWAGKLSEEIKKALSDLNFLDVSFAVQFEEKEHFSESGKDRIAFLISTNPGEPVKPLSKVVSGGELSRIMLAIKTILADKDETGSLIFDEIDTGISGRTAQKVSEKMNVIGQNHQVICITHLPQIAAMADTHFLIEKSVENGGTVTNIRKLEKEEQISELARMLGGAKITDSVLYSAKEMKDLARQQKNTRLK